MPKVPLLGVYASRNEFRLSGPGFSLMMGKNGSEFAGFETSALRLRV